MKTKISLLVLLFSVFLFSDIIGQMVILSGPEDASYYRFVEDINNVLGNGSDKPYINKKTQGAMYNFNQITDPKTPYKVAMVQSDLLFYMQASDMRNNTNKTKDIKVIIPLANEEIHVVTKKSSNLNKLQDLDSTTVAIGNKNQGTYVTSSIMKDRSNMYWISRNIHFDQALKDLYLDEIDAFIIVGSAPVSKLDLNPRAMTDELALVELEDFNDWAKYYDNDTIYKEDYKWLEKDVPTFGVKTVLIVNEAKLTDTDRSEIAKLAKGIKSKFDILKEQGHPKWKEVDLSDWDNSDWPIYK